MASVLTVEVADHPLLDLGILVVDLPRSLADLSTPAWLSERLAAAAADPRGADPTVQRAVRDLLRHGGFKPTGRGKPAAEYLRRAALEGSLASINPAVDAGNAVSLAFGLGVSVVDRDRLVRSGLGGINLSVDLGGPGQGYVFNRAGQIIDVEGLLCLFDDHGPCANAVRDAQRTKTDGATQRLLVLVWGTLALAGHMHEALAELASLFERLGARSVPLGPRLR